uniref:Polyprotein n=1 Tax=Mycena chlorophos TaxID=658473 RepID=A0ABQ0KXD3_MYCCL|nr:polyprotein [Mycena chlorophos]
MPTQYRQTILNTVTTAVTMRVALDFNTLRVTLKEAIDFDVAQSRRKREEAKAMAAHFERQKKQQSQQQQSSKPKKPKCGNCKWNHPNAECRKPGGAMEGIPLPDKPNGKGKGKAKAAAADNESVAASEHHAYVAAAIPDVALRASSAQSLRLLDTGASHHYDGNLANFIAIKPCDPYRIQTASGVEYATQIGTVEFACHQGDMVKTFTLSNTYFLESCTTGLISLTRLRKHGLVFSNAETGYGTLTDKAGKTILRVPERDGVYPLITWRPGSRTAASAATAYAKAARKPLTRTEAHERLGHIAHSTIETMARNGSALGFEVDLSTPIVQCNTCIRAKMKGLRISKKHRDPRSKKPGDFVSADLWGPTRVAARGGYNYYGTFLDDNSDISYVYLQKSKRESETLGHYREFEASMKTQYGADIKVLNTDPGGEYIGGLFDKHLASKGTQRQLTAHGTPQHNGAAERLNGTIAGQMRALLLSSGLPKSFWGLAVLYVVWLRNRLPTKKTAPKSPYEIITGNKPDLSRARRFGCRVWVRVYDGSKLDERGVEAKWVGPSSETPDGHKVYWPKTRTITVERNVRFDDGTVFGEETGEEDVFVPSPTTPDQHKPAQNGSTHTSNPESPPNPTTPSHPASPREPSPARDPVPGPSSPSSTFPAEPLTFTAEDIPADDPDASEPSEVASDVGERRSSRQRKPSEYVRRLQQGEGVTSGSGGQYRRYTRGLQVPNDSSDARATVAYAAFAVPRTYRQAQKSEIWPQWEAAMKAEVETLRGHKTFALIPRSEADGKPILPLKWVYQNRHDEAGDVKQHKARVCVCGDLQDKLGFPTAETFAPVLKFTSRNILLAMAAHHGWHVRQCDFKGAYLNGVLPEPIYVEQPDGIDNPDTPRSQFIWKLFKALYGLKEAGRIWYDTVSGFLTRDLGFTRSEADHGVFFRITNTDHTFLGIHVDDPISLGDNLDALLELERRLDEAFPLKVNGDATHYLGTSIHQDRAAGTISLGQTSYIHDVVALADQQTAHSAPSPMVPGARIGREFCPSSDEKKDAMRNVPYRAVVGSLLWIANGTRPDIAYAVGVLSQFLSNPGRVHWEAAKRVVRYLKGTADARLTFGGTSDGLVGYSDSSWGSEVLNWHSMSGSAFTLHGGAICWSAKKQSTVALSTAEAEYIAMTRATKEAIWIRQFTGELFGDFIKPTTLHVDNQSAIAMARNDSFHSRTKHIALPYHFIRHSVARAAISLTWIQSDANLADLFTKALDSVKTSRLTRALGLTV